MRIIISGLFLSQDIDAINTIMTGKTTKFIYVFTIPPAPTNSGNCKHASKDREGSLSRR